METANLDEELILTKFDQRVNEGIVIYQDYQTEIFSDQGFSLEFRLLSGFVNKPTVSKDPSPPSQSGCRLGSDIDVSGFEVADVGSTHLIAFNKFAAERPHLLLLTQNGYRRQHESLDHDDITSIWHVLTSFSQRRFLILFNCGVDSGCSRLHKHMQIFPAPDPDTFPLWPDSGDPLVRASVPFRCFVYRFEGRLPSPDGLITIYRTLLRKAEDALGRRSSQEGAVPHNVVLDRRWMLLIPRRARGLGGVDVNAAAMVGMIWVDTEERIRMWKEQGPAHILAHVGIPANAN
ncbi:ATP adenylyltransferase-domain-containing protein [Cladorrhinum sp. PSN332]|nr:ATP adenylyltransferase-domain-containing protein [Cladorrhinum sp. PSN332]